MVCLLNFKCSGQDSLDKYSFFGRLNNTDTSCRNYYVNLANKDIAEGNPKLLIMGNREYNFFEKKYGVKDIIFGCIMPDKEDCLKSYNKTIFKYLDSKYGRKWRRNRKWKRKLSADVIGFRKGIFRSSN